MQQICETHANACLRRRAGNDIRFFNSDGYQDRQNGTWAWPEMYDRLKELRMTDHGRAGFS